MTSFRTACWNVYNGTQLERLEPVLRDSLDWGVSLWFVNEARARFTPLFKAHGLQTVVHDQFRLAWDPQRWQLCREWHARLSDAYFKKDGKVPLHCEGQAAILFDTETDRTLEAWSYHTPAHVQKRQNAPGYPMRRYEAFIDTLTTLAERADDSPANGWMAAGDDNWDEDGPKDDGGGIQTDERESIMLGRATGLRQIQAGVPTFGTREIDDYRILRVKQGGGVKPTGTLRVRPGGGAEKPQHQIHEREWVWVR